jgi:cell division transport system permease protein
MIGVSLWRVSRAAVLNFWRNIWLSVATTAIMVITLLMMSFLYFSNIFGAEVLRNFEQKVDVSVTFKENVQPEYIQAIADELTARPEVDYVTVISSEEALNIFKERHADEPLIEETLQELENNPLPASIYIVATDPSLYETIAKSLEADKYSPFIADINFESTRGVIENLIALTDSVKNVAIIVTALFATLAALVMFNTVRLAIYSFREEIEIMRLVGASRWFVQGPFLIESIFVALLAVGITVALLYPLLQAASPELQRFFFEANREQFNLYEYAREHWLSVVGLQLLAAIGLAFISSYVAIRRYLRN